MYRVIEGLICGSTDAMGNRCADWSCLTKNRVYNSAFVYCGSYVFGILHFIFTAEKLRVSKHKHCNTFPENIELLNMHITVVLEFTQEQ